MFFFSATTYHFNIQNKILKIVQKFGPHHFDPSPSPIFLRTFGKEIGKDCETACRRAKKKQVVLFPTCHLWVFGPILKKFWTFWRNFGPILKQFWTDFEENGGWRWVEMVCWNDRSKWLVEMVWTEFLYVFKNFKIAIFLYMFKNFGCS